VLDVDRRFDERPHQFGVCLSYRLELPEVGDIDPEAVNVVTCPGDLRAMLAAAADLATWLRTPVTRNHYDKTIEYQPLPEGPARMAKALLRLQRQAPA
jgi:hypothetical protein